MADSRPNVIFVQSDSMDGRVMGCASHPAAYTPNMDALAARGTLFQNTYCPSPQCCPSRSSMWRGQHVHTAESWSNFKGLAPETPTFKHVLEGNGYRTIIQGRTDHVTGSHSLGNWLAIWTRSLNVPLTAKRPPKAVLDEGRRERVRDVDWARVDTAVEWLRDDAACGHARPFFLHVGFVQPHPGSGYRTSPYYRDMIDRDKVTVPPRDDSNHPAMAYMRATKNCGDTFDDETIRDMRRHYFAQIAEVDAMLGEILKAVEETGRLENTVVIYTSDHGDMGMEHGQYLKNALYEGPARVPFIMAGPGVPQGKVVNDPAMLVDLFPTLMDITGCPKPDWLEGHSLLALANGDTDSRPDWALSQYHANMQQTGSFMLRRGDWKLIEYAGYEPQLFNLREDPDELVNRATTDPEVLGEMAALLRTQLDPDEVDARAKAHDRMSLKIWRNAVGEAGFRDTISRVFRGWTDEHFVRLDAWLSASE